MGWQDRDYASPAPRRISLRGSPALGGHSIVTILIVINVIIFFLAAFSSRMQFYIYDFGVLQAKAVFEGQVWRLLTAQYLHANQWHLFLNMLGLHFLGRPLEQMWSRRRFFGIYTACGLAGNLFYTFLAYRHVIDPTNVAVGASGCIYGLLGIVAVLFPQATVFVYFLFPIKIRTAAAIFGAIAVFSIIQRGQNYGGEACHLAGLVFGVWWAIKGQDWWDNSEWRWKPKRRSPIRRTESFQQRMAAQQADNDLVDRILDKVRMEGLNSLTDREKQALHEATERQRRRDEGPPPI